MNISYQDLERSKEWNRILGNEYQFGDKNKKKHMKALFARTTGLCLYELTIEELRKMSSFNLETFAKQVPAMTASQVYDAYIGRLANQPTRCTPVTPEKCNPTPPIKGKKKMSECYNCGEYVPPASPSDRKLEYFLERAHAVRYSKENDLLDKFYMNDDSRPSTPKDLIERIQEGKFIVPSDRMDQSCYSASDCFKYFTWRDPKHPKDQKGYDAACEKLDAFHTKTKDAMWADSSKAHEQLEAFEKKTFH